MREMRHVSLFDLQLPGLSVLHPVRAGHATSRRAREAVLTPTPPSAQYIVRAAVAPLHAGPSAATPLVSQRVAGQVLTELERDPGGGWLRVVGSDDYAGWVHRGYLAPVVEISGGPAMVSLGCAVVAANDPARVRRPLPLGATLAASEVCVEGRAVAAAEIPHLFPRDPTAVTQSARELFAGTSYLWGGVTPWGADCSGFVQTVFGLHGVALPRDAWQQAMVGTDAGTDPLRVAPAGLLFFSERDDGRVTHVGISVGDSAMAHVALGRGGHAIDRLSADDPYVTALVTRFRFARRVM